MKKYRVTIESIFVHLPDGMGRGLYGYFSTFEAVARDAKHALREILPQLGQRIVSSGVRVRHAGIFRTRYFVEDVWEAADEPSLPEFVGGGFVYFRITPLSAVVSFARFLLVRLTKPYLLFSPQQELSHDLIGRKKASE